MPTSFEVESANAEPVKNFMTVHSLVNTSGSNSDLESIISPDRFSARLKLLRVTARVIQFVERLKSTD